MEIKPKLNKWGLMKLTGFYTAKETITKTKSQPTGWGKILANDATNRELNSKVYK